MCGVGAMSPRTAQGRCPEGHLARGSSPSSDSDGRATIISITSIIVIIMLILLLIFVY